MYVIKPCTLGMLQIPMLIFRISLNQTQLFWVKQIDDTRKTNLRNSNQQLPHVELKK